MQKGEDDRMESIKRWTMFLWSDIGEIETYFSDMARRGYLLEKQGSLMSEFIKGEPKERRYRVVPAVGRKISEEEKEVYRETGWEYVSDGGSLGTRLDIFFSDDKEAPEIFTDTESFKSHIRKFMLLALACVLCWIWFGATFLEDLAGDVAGPIHSMMEYGIVTWSLIILVGLFVLVIIVDFVISAGMLMWQISVRKRIDHERPYRGKIRFRIVSRISLIVLLVCMLVSIPFAGTTVVVGDELKEDIEGYKGNHPASFEILDEEKWQEIQQTLDRGQIPEDFDFVKTSDLMAPSKTELWVWEEDEEYYGVYMEMRSEKLAEVWLEEELDMYGKTCRQAELAGSESSKVDYVGYLDLEGGQALYLKKGSRIEKIWYTGDKDVREYVGDFIDRF